MATQRKFRFGIMTNGMTQLPGEGPVAPRWKEFVRKVEGLGYDTLSLPDHLDQQLAPLPALAAAAAVTKTLRLGSLVWCNDYKHPVILAKEVATLDVLSEGRLQLGLGAGWMKTDYEQAGLPYDSPGVRIERMMEGLEVLRGHFGKGAFSFAGKHYRIEELDGFPKPVQNHVPVLIGGGGKRVLSLAAQHADIVGVNVDLREGQMGAHAAANATAEAAAQKIAWIREAAGENYSQLELNVLLFSTNVTDNARAAYDELGKQFGAPVEVLVESPHILVGSVESMVETLEKRRELYDLSYVVIRGDQMEAFAPVLESLKGR